MLMSYLFDELKSDDSDVKVEDKILFMGLQQAGKTAIKDVVFFGKKPGEVEDYMATVHYERQYIDEEKTNLIIDSGGQENYWNEAVTHFRHLVFSNVKILFWIIDMTRPNLFEESERRFSFTIRQFKKENPEGIITVLCHKVDLIPPEELVPLLGHVADTFDENKYNIRFEPSSIYYAESLKELIFTLMNEVNMNSKRFELITNIGQKIEESDEFQSYVMEHEEDPRIKQLMEFLNPEPQATLPTFGKMAINFDLSEYDIVEIVLIDRETFSPVVGTSSKGAVSSEKSIDYISALQEFKTIIKEKKEISESTTASIITSSNNKVNAMVFNLDKNILLITSFSAITEDKTRIFYELIRKFAQSTDETPQAPIDNINLPAVPSEAKEVTVKAPKSKADKKIPKLKVAQAEVVAETSSFTFLNKLKDELKSTPTEPIQVHLDEPKPKTGPIAPLVTETPTEVQEKISLPVTESIAEINETVVVEEPIQELVTDKPDEHKIAIEEEVKEAVLKTDKILKPVKKGFMDRLKEERKRYNVKQIELLASNLEGDSEEKLTLSKSDVKRLVEFLVQQKSSEENKEQ